MATDYSYGKNIIGKLAIEYEICRLVLGSTDTSLGRPGTAVAWSNQSKGIFAGTTRGAENSTDMIYEYIDGTNRISAVLRPPMDVGNLMLDFEWRSSTHR